MAKGSKAEKESTSKAQPARSKNIGSLKDLNAIRLEMSRLYRDARQGLIAPGEATRLCYILISLSRVLEAIGVEDDASSANRLIEIMGNLREQHSTVIDAPATAGNAERIPPPEEEPSFQDAEQDVARDETQGEEEPSSSQDEGQDEQPHPRRYYIPAVPRGHSRASKSWGPAGTSIVLGMAAITDKANWPYKN